MQVKTRFTLVWPQSLANGEGVNVTASRASLSVLLYVAHWASVCIPSRACFRLAPVDTSRPSGTWSSHPEARGLFPRLGSVFSLLIPPNVSRLSRDLPTVLGFTNFIALCTRMSLNKTKSPPARRLWPTFLLLLFQICVVSWRCSFSCLY